jgi:uncharacterized membrane protein YfcA
MDPFEIGILILAGFFCGILNTLAGFGSIISLAVYMDVLNIPGHIANATNRVNILASSNIAAYTFYKNGKLKLSGDIPYIVITLIGAIVGAVIASYVNEDQFKVAFKYLLIPILLLLLSNPKKFMFVKEGEKSASAWIIMPLLFIIGIYAGFIQAGFGILFLMIVVMLGRYNLVRSNALKIAVVAVYTIFVVGWFWWKGLIQWVPGLTMAVGQSVGGYITARYLSNFDNANKVAYYFLILILVLVIIKNFELYTYLGL